MDIKYLEYVLETAKQKNISRAAEVLYISQSTLSQALLRLEQEIGTPLFARTKNGLLLTPAGELYVNAARQVVEIRRRLYDDIAGIAGIGRFRIGVSSRWGMQMLAELLPAFHQQFPSIAVEIFQDKYQLLRQRWKEEKLDLAVTAVSGQDDFPGEYRLLRREEICLAIPAGHSKSGLVQPQKPMNHAQLVTAFGKEKFICSDPGSTMYQVERGFFRAMGFHPRIICEVNDNLAALRMVEQGVGVAFLPANYARGNPAVVCCCLTPRLERSNILIVSSRLQHTTALHRLCRLIEEYPLFQQENKAVGGAGME